MALVEDVDPGSVQIVVKCDSCGVEGGSNTLVVPEDRSCVWECTGCGAKNYYTSSNDPPEVTHVSVTESIEATSSTGG